MDTAAKVPVEIAAWRPAPFDLAGETVFAIGDVHGCAEELRALLVASDGLARENCNHKRLIYLGDMINRGPDSAGVLELWARDEAAHGVDHVDRLMGNHEIMMLLAAIGGPHAHKAETMWLSKRMGGQVLLDQMRAQARQPAARADLALFEASLGDQVMHRLYAMRSHVTLGTALFVHAGVAPHADLDQILTPALTLFPQAPSAWINRRIPDGTAAVHGTAARP